ncbi:unnamed protein product [Rhizoctonia solani]|uniref:Uncharacterized protein n=1 Tax=Rhizoctonia solani TaxID=456999 RepID=A0A8H2XTR0_9AGAM|nr:unnamed protein product [Rhizoctonia solani]
MSHPPAKPRSFWAYLFTKEELIWHARRSGLPFANDEDFLAMLQYALHLYHRFEPLGPVRLYGAFINDEPGMAITLGYPHDELNDLPPALLSDVVHVLGEQPRRVTRVKLRGSRYTSPVEHEGRKWKDKINIYGKPEKRNCLWLDSVSARAFVSHTAGTMGTTA